MRNLHDLFDEVCNTMHELGIDPQDVLDDVVSAQSAAAAVRVVAAYQPSYPIAGVISHLKVLDHEKNDEKNENKKVVWVALGGHPHDMNPYAPGDAFDSDW